MNRNSGIGSHETESGRHTARRRKQRLAASQGRLRTAALSVAAISLFVSRAADAQNVPVTYTGGASGELDSTGSWSSGSVPVVSNDALINTSTGAASGITLNAGNVTFGSLNDTDTSAVTITGNQSLTLGGSGDLGNGLSGNTSDLIYVGSSSTLNYGGNGSIVLGQAGNFDIAGTGNISAPITSSGGFGFTKTGSGTLYLYVGTGSTTANVGDVTISAGTIFTESNNTFGNLTVNGTLDLGGSAAAYTMNVNGLTGSGNITTNGSGGYARTLYVGNGNATSAFSGKITQAGNRGLNFDKVGTGTLTLNGNSSNVQGGGSGSFSTSVQGGVLILDMSNAVALPGAVTVSSGATLQLSGTGGNQIADAATVGISSGGVFDLNGQSETTSTVSLAGSGISSGGALINSNSGTTSTLTAPVSLTATTTMGGAGNLTVNGNISGSGDGLVYNGSGVLTLAGTNSYTGSTSVSSGLLSVTGILGGNTAVSTSGTGNLTVSNVNGLTGSSSLTVGTGTTATLMAANNNTGATTVTGTLNLQDGNATASSAITLNTGSTLQLRGNTSTVFNTANASGLVVLQGNPSTTTTFDVNNNGSNTGNSLTLASGISWTGPGSGTGAGTYTNTINVTGGNATTLVLPRVNYTDGASYASGSPRNFVLDFNPTTGNVSLGNVTLSGSGNRIGVYLTLGGNATGNSVTGAIAISSNQTSSVTVNGGGTWAVTGSSTYSQNTAVNAGSTLLADNASGSATGSGSVTVAVGTSGNYSGSVLGGNGTVSGTVYLTGSSTAKLGGIIAAGANASTIGTLTTGNQTWNQGAAYEWKISSPGNATTLGDTATISGTPGTGGGYDFLQIGGNLTSGSLLSVQPSGSTAFTIAPIGNITVTGGGTYNWPIAQIGSGTLTQVSLNGIATSPSGTQLSPSIFALDTSSLYVNGSNSSALDSASNFGVYFETVNGNNDLVLSYNSTPEPGTVILALGGMAPMLLARRRRGKHVAT